MDSIFEKITQAINDFLISLIEDSLGTMFNDVNEKVGTIAAEVGKTPQDYVISTPKQVQPIYLAAMHLTAIHCIYACCIYT